MHSGQNRATPPIGTHVKPPRVAGLHQHTPVMLALESETGEHSVGQPGLQSDTVPKEKEKVMLSVRE